MAALPGRILPDPTLVQLDDITVEEAHGAMTLVMSVTARTAVCPLCSREAERIHSRYVRTLADLAWADVPVRVLLGVRRFFCDTSDCTRRIFSERLGTIARPWARRTTRLATTQQQLGLIAGGSAGSVLCTTLAYPTSGDTLLRLIRQSTPQHQPTPRVLGVDDWVRPVPSKQASSWG